MAKSGKLIFQGRSFLEGKIQKIGKKFFENLLFKTFVNSQIFSFLLGDLCEDALDLSSGKLNIDNSWRLGTYCQWLLPVEDDNSYITVEFHKLEVST